MSVQQRLRQWAAQSASPREWTLHLANIPAESTKAELMQFLEDRGYGGDYDLFYLPRCFDTGRHFGYAFLNFLEGEIANRFLEEMNGLHISPGRRLVVKSSATQGLQENLSRWARARARRVKDPGMLPFVRGLTDLGEPNPAQAVLTSILAPGDDQVPAPQSLLPGGNEGPSEGSDVNSHPVLATAAAQAPATRGPHLGEGYGSGKGSDVTSPVGLAADAVQVPAPRSPLGDSRWSSMSRCFPPATNTMEVQPPRGLLLGESDRSSHGFCVNSHRRRATDAVQAVSNFSVDSGFAAAQAKAGCAVGGAACGFESERIAREDSAHGTVSDSAKRAGFRDPTGGGRSSGSSGCPPGHFEGVASGSSVPWSSASPMPTDSSCTSEFVVLRRYKF